MVTHEKGDKLRKSMALLNESVGGSPSSFLKTFYNSPNTMAEPSFLGVSPGKPSAQMNPTFFQTPNKSLNFTRMGDTTLGRTLLQPSPMNATTYTPTRNETLFNETAALTTNVATLLDEDPEIAACGSLYGDFESVMHAHPSENQVFSLITHYEKLCQTQVDMLSQLHHCATPGSHKFGRLREVLELLTKERSTWRLVSSLYRDRVETELAGNQDDEPMMTDTEHGHVSDRQIADSLMRRSAQARQAQLVVDWLELNAQEQLKTFYDKVEHFTDQSMPWENTLHALKQRSQGVPSYSDRPLVDEMDPDAPLRQKRPLADLDQEDDVRLLRYVFNCVRAGMIEEAQRICTKCGQAWRAATLEGWRLYHDSNYECSGPGGVMKPVEGNVNRALWKAACWKLAQNERVTKYESALYAALSGNLPALLPVCESWEDQVWAHFKVLVDTMIEEEIRIHSMSDRNMIPLPNGYGKQCLNSESVFKMVEASPSEMARQESKYRFHIIQKYIILGDLDGLIEEMYEWTKSRDKPHPHLLRFMAHLLLFFRASCLNTNEKFVSLIMEAYVKDLVETRKLPLVARYVSKLPQESQVQWYARFLDGVTDNDERQFCLNRAVDAGLDTHAITKLVVENIRKRPSADLDTETDTPQGVATTKEDREKIEAIDWLVFDVAQRAEAMRQANAIMRSFLGMRKLCACKEAFEKLPSDSIDVVVRNWRQESGSTELNADIDNNIREYLCIRAYLEAHESFNDWFAHFYNAKPISPETVRSMDFAHKVALEHKQKQYEEEMARWSHSLKLQTKTTTDRLYNVLLFAEGWMIDQRTDGTPDEQRGKQMALLRKLCLPTTCFILQKVLLETKQHQETAQLADLLASERYQLYTVFNKDELQRFLQQLHQCSVALLEGRTDAVGYRVS